MLSQVRRTSEGLPWVDALVALQRLDTAVKARAAHLAIPSTDRDLRGLLISEHEFSELLSEPLATLPHADGNERGSTWQRLIAALALSSFEQDLLLLCLALEVDRGYERIYAYLQDDFTARQPTVGLALDLLCDGPAARMAARRALAPDAPLRAWRLIRLLPGREDASSLLAHSLALAPGVAAHLLEGGGLPPWLERLELTDARAALQNLGAEVIAAELELDLFKIDLSGVVSKYVGETEKNLERIFSQARHANAILLFDEADALFGKRSETKDAHDRYANIEISYLLQKVEEYEGVVILTSNLQQNLDETFLRRTVPTDAGSAPARTRGDGGTAAPKSRRASRAGLGGRGPAAGAQRPAGPSQATTATDGGDGAPPRACTLGGHARPGQSLAPIPAAHLCRG